MFSWLLRGLCGCGKAPGRRSGPGALPGAGLCQPGAAVEQVDVGGSAGEEELALCFPDAAHGELAQAGTFFQVGEAALGDGGAVAVQVAALAGGQVVVHLVAGVVVVAAGAVGA